MLKSTSDVRGSRQHGSVSALCRHSKVRKERMKAVKYQMHCLGNKGGLYWALYSTEDSDMDSNQSILERMFTKVGDWERSARSNTQALHWRKAYWSRVVLGFNPAITKEHAVGESCQALLLQNYFTETKVCASTFNDRRLELLLTLVKQ